MRYFLFLCLALLSTLANAAVCPKLEYVELDSLSREELLEMHCQYRADMMHLATGGPSAVNFNLADRCAEEMSRTERIVARKYAIKSTGAQRIKDTNALCPAAVSR